MTRLVRPSPISLGATLFVLALFLAAAFSFFQPPPAHAQTVNPATVTISSQQTSVYEGQGLTFTLTRTGGTVGDELTVVLDTYEAGKYNSTLTEHSVTFHPGATSADLTVLVPVDGESEPGTNTFSAELRCVGTLPYNCGTQWFADIEIDDAPQDSQFVSVSASSTSVIEGSATTLTFTRTGGSTLQELAVSIQVDDPGDRLRGNHWDPVPEIPTEVVIPAGSTTAEVTLSFPDDQRDLTGPGLVEVSILLSVNYFIVNIGTSVTISVEDNDTTQELELHFGKDGTNDADVNEGDTLKLVVKRRQVDAGQTSTFTVRVETDRSGADPALEDWTEDSDTGRLYHDYDLEMTGAQSEVEESITVTENGAVEDDWNYWASIRPIEDVDGTALDAAVEAEYWTVKTGFRETDVTATDSRETTASVSIDTTQTTVYEGQVVTYTLTRIGGTVGDELTVVLDTYEEGKYNSTLTEHSVTFHPGATSADLTVLVPVDGDSEPGTNTFFAELRCVGTLPYNCGTQWFADIEIDDLPQDSQFVSVWASATLISEGSAATLTFTRTGGSTAQDLTVDIRVNDPEDRLRGNHWDPAPAIPTQVVIPAGSTTASITLTFPDDQRDLPSAGLVAVSILPSDSYFLDNTGTSVTLGVTDNDDAQELALKWGWFSATDSNWNPGESYFVDCPGGGIDYDCPGPAEGIFYYEDERDFQYSAEIEPYFPIHFQVTRRAADRGKTANFVVRVEHDRGWLSPRHADWPLDPVTGNHYFDFPLTLTGNQRTVVGRIEVLDNARRENWNFSARILPAVDSTTGSALTAEQEAQYWTVRGKRNESIRSNVFASLEIVLKAPIPETVPEGDQVVFRVNRKRGYALEPLTIQVRTWEPNHGAPDGTNPTDQIHTLVFPALPMTSEFVESRGINQTLRITVTTTQDTLQETSDVIKAELTAIDQDVDLFGGGGFQHFVQANISDDDYPTISLAADATGITEGEPVTFTLTRGNNTAVELIVGVTVDDPGGFLEGNHASEAVEVPSSLVFAPGETTKELTLTPPDDWRDIPDSALTFTVAAEPGYEIVGPASLTVQVADNDVAPQVQISFNHAEVDEGEDLVLTIARIGEDKNDLEVELTLGPVGNQRYSVTGLDPGQQSVTIVYSLPDDQFKGPDTHYQATLHPGNPEFWVPTGATTVNGAILDNDLYTVGVRGLTASVDEGQLLYYRLYHDGHTGEHLQVNVELSEHGNAVLDPVLGERTLRISSGHSELESFFFTERNDGADGTAIFIMKILPGDGYTVDPNHGTAHIAVQDVDPLPVLGLRSSSSVEVSEGVGTAEIWVDLTSTLPVPRQVEVDYEILEGSTAIDGADFTASVGTLVFSPGETSKAVEVPILQDNLVEYTERFSVELKNPVFADLEDGATTLTAEVVIEDDEPFVTMEAAAAAVNEGTDAVFNLSRRRNTSDELAVYVQVTRSGRRARYLPGNGCVPSGTGHDAARRTHRGRPRRCRAHGRLPP